MRAATRQLGKNVKMQNSLNTSFFQNSISVVFN